MENLSENVNQKNPVFKSDVLDGFPVVCANAMSDKRLQELLKASRKIGFGAGPIKDHFKGFESFPSDHQTVIPTTCRFDFNLSYSGHDLVLLALNYQNRTEEADSAEYIPPIAARLSAYLYVLTMDPVLADYRFQPGASELAQRQLSALLVDYPVLMHPELHVASRSFFVAQGKSLTKPTLSVTNAIALALYARFPMAKDGLCVDQLTAYANDRCTKLGLSTRSAPIVATFDNKKTTTPFGLSFELSHIKPALIASLHEISKLTKLKSINVAAAFRRNPYTSNPASSHSPGLFSHLEYQPDSDRDSDGVEIKVKWSTLNNPFNAFSYLKDDTAYVYQQDFSGIFVKSFIAACGVGGRLVFENVEHSRFLMDTRIPVPEFFTVFRELRLYENLDVAKTLKRSAFVRIFQDENNIANSPTKIAEGVHQIAAGLIAARVVKDRAEAGVWFLSEIHHQVSMPLVTIESATAFISSLDEYGTMVDWRCLDPLSSPDMTSNQSNAFLNPAKEIWKNAARIHEVEKAMAQVIKRSHGENDGEVPGNMTGAESTRRRRVQI